MNSEQEYQEITMDKIMKQIKQLLLILATLATLTACYGGSNYYSYYMCPESYDCKPHESGIPWTPIEPAKRIESPNIAVLLESQEGFTSGAGTIESPLIVQQNKQATLTYSVKNIGKGVAKQLYLKNGNENHRWHMISGTCVETESGAIDLIENAMCNVVYALNSESVGQYDFNGESLHAYYKNEGGKQYESIGNGYLAVVVKSVPVPEPYIKITFTPETWDGKERSYYPGESFVMHAQLINESSMQSPYSIAIYIYPDELGAITVWGVSFAPSDAACVINTTAGCDMKIILANIVRQNEFSMTLCNNQNLQMDILSRYHDRGIALLDFKINRYK